MATQPNLFSGETLGPERSKIGALRDIALRNIPEISQNITILRDEISSSTLESSAQRRRALDSLGCIAMLTQHPEDADILRIFINKNANADFMPASDSEEGLLNAAAINEAHLRLWFSVGDSSVAEGYVASFLTDRDQFGDPSNPDKELGSRYWNNALIKFSLLAQYQMYVGKTAEAYEVINEISAMYQETCNLKLRQGSGPTPMSAECFISRTLSDKLFNVLSLACEHEVESLLSKIGDGSIVPGDFDQIFRFIEGIAAIYDFESRDGNPRPEKYRIHPDTDYATPHDIKKTCSYYEYIATGLIGRCSIQVEFYPNWRRLLNDMGDRYKHVKVKIRDIKNNNDLEARDNLLNFLEQITARTFDPRALELWAGAVTEPIRHEGQLSFSRKDRVKYRDYFIPANEALDLVEQFYDELGKFDPAYVNNSITRLVEFIMGDQNRPILEPISDVFKAWKFLLDHEPAWNSLSLNASGGPDRVQLDDEVINSLLLSRLSSSSTETHMSYPNAGINTHNLRFGFSIISSVGSVDPANITGLIDQIKRPEENDRLGQDIATKVLRLGAVIGLGAMVSRTDLRSAEITQFAKTVSKQISLCFGRPDNYGRLPDKIFERLERLIGDIARAGNHLGMGKGYMTSFGLDARSLLELAKAKSGLDTTRQLPSNLTPNYLIPLATNYADLAEALLKASGLPNR